MLTLFKKRLKNQRGFTLVELMAVVVIIGILIAIAIPVYSNIQEGVKQRADQASLRVLNGAAQAWAMDQDPVADLKALPSGVTMTVALLKGEGEGEDNIQYVTDITEKPQSKKYGGEGDDAKDWDDYWDSNIGAFVFGDE